MSNITVGGGGGRTILTLTDGTNTVADVAQITVTGGTVGGTTPDATLTINTRTILTANLPLYVDPLGSDSYNGLSATFTGGVNGPKATYQGAMDELSSTYDTAGFDTQIIGAAGSYVGFGVKSIVGGGFLQILGAGSALTTLTAGPNDGSFNFGECFSWYRPTSVAIAIDGVTFDVSSVPSGISGVSVQIPGITFVLGNELTQSLDIACVGSINQNYFAFLEQSFYDVLPIGTGTGITLPGGATCNSVIDVGQGSQLTDAGTWQIVGGSLTCNYCYANLNSAGTYFSFNATHSGTATGTVPYGIIGNSTALSVNGPGQLGPHYFPGDQPGSCDASSSYDEFPGPSPTTVYSALPTLPFIGNIYTIDDCTSITPNATAGGSGPYRALVWFTGTTPPWLVIGGLSMTLISTPTLLGVQDTPASNPTITTGAAAAAGSLVVVALGAGQTPDADLGASITDSAGNTYTRDIQSVAATGYYSCNLFSSVLATMLPMGGTISITAGQQVLAAACVVTGASSGTDVALTSNVTGTTLTINSGTLAQANEILFGVFAPLHSWASDTAPFAEIPGGSFGGLGFAYAIVSSTSSVAYSPTANVLGQNSAVLASYKH